MRFGFIDHDPHGDIGWLMQPITEQVDGGHRKIAQAEFGIGHRERGRHPTVVVEEDHQPGAFVAGQAKPAALRAGNHLHPISQVLPKHLGQTSRRPGDAARRNRPVVEFRIDDMRQQVEAAPVSRGFAGKCGCNPYVVRRVQRSQLHDHRAGSAEHALPITDDGDLTGPVEVHSDRHATDDLVVGDHRVHLVDHDRVIGLYWVLFLGHGKGEHGAVADAESYPTEVGVVTAALPEPGRISNQLHQSRRLRIQQRRGCAHFTALDTHPGAQLLQKSR